MDKILTALAFASATALALGLICKNANAGNVPEPDRPAKALAVKWKEYDKALAKDNPQKQAKILESIKADASDRHLLWDWWDASCRYGAVRSSINWKLRDSLTASLGDEVREMEEPLLSFEYARKYGNESEYELLDRVESSAASLRQTRHRAFWNADSKVSSAFSATLPKYIENDYEYALWAILPTWGNENGLKDNRTAQKLGAVLGDRYPVAGMLRYRSILAISYEDKRRDALRDFVSEYAGKALAYYAEAELLDMEMSSLARRSAGSDGYRSLLARCEAFERGRRSLRGEEAKMAGDIDGVRDLIKRLNSSEVEVSAVQEDTLVLRLRNKSSVRVGLYKDSKLIFSAAEENAARSFYAYDTIRIALPKLDDGEYTVKCSGVDRYSFEKYSISLALREDSEGYSVYAAEQYSGRPLSRINLELCKNGKQLVAVEGVTLQEGFTALPQEISSLINASDIYGLAASCTSEDGLMLKSKTVNTGYYSHTSRYSHASSSPAQECVVFTDRGAYNPGDTMHFKSVFYRETDAQEVIPGMEVRAVLYDADGKRVDESLLITNDFGSAAGSFCIPKGLKGGYFRLELASGDGAVRSSRGVRVDEFVTPSFELAFDAMEDIIRMPGDTVRFSGKVTSYSGHGMSSAALRYMAVVWGSVLAEGSAEIAKDGTFVIEVPTPFNGRSGEVMLEAVLADGTGESFVYNTSVKVSKAQYLYMYVCARDSSISPHSHAAHLELLSEPGGGYADAVRVAGDSVCVFMDAPKSSDAHEATVRYSLHDESGTEISHGHTVPGAKLELHLPEQKMYCLKARLSVSGRNGEADMAEAEMKFVRIDRDASAIDAPVDCFFEKIDENGRTGLRLGSTTGDVWAVVDVFDGKRHLLGSRCVHIDGRRGEDGSLEDILFDYKDEWPDAVHLNVFYFKHSSEKSWKCSFYRAKETEDLPLSFTSFTDKAFPGQHCEISVQADSAAECLAAVFDRSIDNIVRNDWGVVRKTLPHSEPVRVNVSSGGIYGRMSYTYIGRHGRIMAKGGIQALVAEAAEADYARPESSNELLAAPVSASAVSAADHVAIRGNFAGTLAFEPFLYPGQDGKVTLAFETSDRLSTYHVQVYAHDRSMRNKVVCRDMVVTLPLKLAVSEPKYMYAGDSLSLAVTASANADVPVGGKLYMYRYDTGDWRSASPVSEECVSLCVQPGAVAVSSFAVNAPAAVSAEGAVIGLKLVFVSDDGKWSDGMFVSVPVRPDKQVITEAHSAVLLPGADRDSLVAGLRSAFEDVGGAGEIIVRELSLMDMVRAAIPARTDPESDNVIDLSEAYYMRLVAGSLGVDADAKMSVGELRDKIFACKNADGGFSWFSGMESSPVITALLLERFAKLRDAGLMPADFPELDSAVKFLDSSTFTSGRPIWRGGISYEQYLYARSYYPAVPFGDIRGADGKTMSEFRKYVSSYLLPAVGRGMSGRVLAKARRAAILSRLSASDEGMALAKAWGAHGLGRVEKSLDADVASLLEYMVPHKDGGMYCPNAVMPWRGLLESEAYAHSLICDLMSEYASCRPDSEYAGQAARASDGIRIWLMLQKETQQWAAEPAFVDAVQSVISGSESVKSVSVLALSRSCSVPFSDISATGNGMSVERRFFREVTVDADARNMYDADSSKVAKWEEIAPGEMLHRGEKIRVEYKIWNGENRSHILLTAPRGASLRPVNQLSGFTFGGYRDVRSDRSMFYFDSYPEEESRVVEEFLVTAQGRFVAPSVSIESLYAPHYRANSAVRGPVEVR